MTAPDQRRPNGPMFSARVCFSAGAGGPGARRLPVPGLSLAVFSRRRRDGEAVDVDDAVRGGRRLQLDVSPRDGRDGGPAERQGGHEGGLPRRDDQRERRVRPQGRAVSRRLSVGRAQRHLPSADTRRSRASESPHDTYSTLAILQMISISKICSQSWSWS